MTAERERRESNSVTQQVADEGNVPGQRSTRGTLLIAIFVLIGLGLIYFASANMADHHRTAPQTSRQ